MHFHIILLRPEIPQNTGNIIRLAANSGCHLHLVQPLGFTLDDKRLRRAGLDYHEYAEVQIHPDLASATATCGRGRVFALSADGKRRYDNVDFQSGDVFLFGCESVGLAAAERALFPEERYLFIPMRTNSRSLNLSNAVAVVVMEAWRQLGFS